MTPKTVQKFTKELKILYVEDDIGIRESTTELFKQFFSHVDVAEDGQQGLSAYNSYYEKEKTFYDFVITDINMPHMNGIEMIKEINKRNMKQTIIITSAHDDATYLIPLIELGVDSFILKPFKMESLLNVFFKNAQKVVDRKFVFENFTHMKIRYKQLSDAFKVLKQENMALELKCKSISAGETMSSEDAQAQVATEIANNPEVVVDDSEYFAKDEDDGDDKILLLDEHAQDLLDRFEDISEKILHGASGPDAAAIKIVEDLAGAAAVFEFYSPYIDILAASFRDLGDSIYRNMSSFTDIMENDLDSISILFDALYNDMKGYATRFRSESLAMKNIHHIHEPTALSIQQIITLIAPEEVDAGEIEFF
jgi:DNA-binding response OmpR family regulator